MTTKGGLTPEIPSGVLEQPLYVSTERGAQFGWLDRPAGRSSSDVGVVICKPFGHEALCGHRSLRTFARVIAQGGAPALTFDYLGTGDSEDLDANADQIEQWCQDIVATVAMLRRTAGVQRVCLLGFRLGATLALMAADRTEVDALILVAPVMKGSVYLRQVRTPQALTGRKVASAYGDSSNAAIEVNGYYLSRASVLRLNELDLCELPPGSLAAALIVHSGAGLPATRAWASSLTARGVQADCIVQSGFVDMMIVPPHNAQIPWGMISSVQSWLLRFMSSSLRAKRQLEATTKTTSTPLSSLEVASDAGSLLMEQPVYFGRDARLFGIVTEPRTLDRPLRGVVLVNAGAESHVGTGRIYVWLARQWAEQGCVVLRMDLAGLGDSKAFPGRRENDVYSPGATDDIRSAVEFLRERYRLNELSVGGVCSGGYHAFRAAAAGVEFNRLFMVNPETFLWRDDRVYAADVLRVVSLLREHALSVSGWKRLFTGRIDPVRQTKLLGQRLLWSLTSRAQRLLQLVRIRLPNDVAGDFQAVTARGVEIIMVFSRGELGLKLLELQAGDILRSLSERGRLHIVDGVDHMFTGDAARRALQMLLSQSFAMAEPPGARADAHRAAAGARETPDTAADTWRSAARCRASN